LYPRRAGESPVFEVERHYQRRRGQPGGSIMRASAQGVRPWNRRNTRLSPTSRMSWDASSRSCAARWIPPTAIFPLTSPCCHRDRCRAQKARPRTLWRSFAATSIPSRSPSGTWRASCRGLRWCSSGWLTLPTR